MFRWRKLRVSGAITKDSRRGLARRRAGSLEKASETTWRRRRRTVQTPFTRKRNARFPVYDRRIVSTSYTTTQMWIIRRRSVLQATTRVKSKTFSFINRTGTTLTRTLRCALSQTRLQKRGRLETILRSSGFNGKTKRTGRSRGRLCGSVPDLRTPLPA